MTHKSTTGIAMALAVITVGLSTPLLAHHGFGRFDRNHEATIEGTITGIEFVNPHSYLHFDSVNANGEPIAMRCEMRAATLLRRSGWSAEMFIVGAHATIFGYKHRDDPHSCYLEDITIGDSEELNRNDQLEHALPDTSERPLRLSSGEPNIYGDWAQEQYVIAIPPSGRGVGLVPKSMKPGIESGELSTDNIPDAGWGPPRVELTARGKAEAEPFETYNPEYNPRLRCEPTSIIFDWVHDGPVNRIIREDDRIVIYYGLYSNERVIHMDMDEHPASIKPSNQGHSIGHWEGDTLVVDTVGIEPGVIAPPVSHSDQLHIVERFSLATEPLRLVREYVATDPVYFAEPYVNSDTLLVADVPFVDHGCDELTFEYGAGEVKK